jgi:hypothetical protein
MCDNSCQICVLVKVRCVGSMRSEEHRPIGSAHVHKSHHEKYRGLYTYKLVLRHEDFLMLIQISTYMRNQYENKRLRKSLQESTRTALSSQKRVL